MNKKTHQNILSALFRQSSDRRFLYIRRFKEVQENSGFTPVEQVELCNLLDGMIQEAGETMADIAYFQSQDNAARLERQTVLTYGNGKTFRI